MNSDYYETSDLGLAAALLTYGVVLVRVDKQNPKRALFNFAVSAELSTVVDSFWSGEMKLSAVRYFENIKLLKSRIYGG